MRQAGVLLGVLVYTIACGVITTANVASGATNPTAGGAWQQFSFATDLRMVIAVSNQHANIQPALTGHYICKLPFGYWISRIYELKSRSRSGEYQIPEFFFYGESGRGKLSQAVGNYSLRTRIGWNLTGVDEEKSYSNFLSRPCDNCVGIKRNGDIGPRTEFQRTHGYIRLLDSYPCKYDGEDSYKCSSNSSNKIRRVVSGFDSLLDSRRYDVSKFSQVFIGTLLWFAACVFVVLGLGFIGHNTNAIFAPVFFLIAGSLIWFGFWLLV